MKNIALFLINFYQAFASTIIKSISGSPSVCRFDETCSEYAKRMVIEKGALRGFSLGFVRLLKCQPLYHNL